MPALKTLLHRFPIFQPLTDTEFDRIARAVERRAYPAHSMIFQEGEFGDALFMIASGQVEIYSTSGELENRLNVLAEGDWFGELALIDDQPRSGSARTLSKTLLLCLPKPEFRALVAAHPITLYTLAAETQHRLRMRDRAYEAEMQTRLQQLHQLHDTALDITRHLDRAQALEAIRERAVELLRSAGGEIYLHDAKHNLLVPEGQSGMDSPPKRVGEGNTGRVYVSGQAEIAKPTRRATMFELAAPIKLDTRSLGVLTVVRASDGTPYQDADKTLLELFASQAAIVIENADLHKTRLDKERLDTQLNDARRVQRSLIPETPPQLRGYQVSALWHPASQVSGDYYDFIPMTNGRIGFVIGDVSGKGLDAALFMANTRSVLRASASVGGTPTEIISRANDTLAIDSPGGMFVTLFFGILDPRSGLFSYVNAGHNLPFLRRAQGGKLETLGGGNRALGITPQYDYTSNETQLEHGDLIVLYTDGVTEATASNNTLFGEARLAASLFDCMNDSARQVIRYVDERVREFTGAQPQSDDITVVTLRRN